MAVTLKIIENLLVKENRTSSLSSILLEYAILKQKLENADSRSWYFKKGMASYEQRLTSLTKDYENIRKLFNETTVDYLIHKINNNNAHISNFDKNAMNAVASMGFGLLRNNNELYNELLRLNSKTDALMPMDYYLQNPEALLEIMD